MKKSLLMRLVPIVTLATTALLPACADDQPVGPGDVSMSVVAGDYEVGGSFGTLTFRTADGNEQIDWREAGANLTLRLSADGTVSGQLHIPVAGHEDYFEDEDVERGYMEADMAGTWTLDNGIVRFEQDADSFIRDMEFTYADGVLAAERTFDGVAVTVVLVRQ